MLKWDIYQLDQDKALNEQDPVQAIDRTKPRRYYIIISPNLFNKKYDSVIAIPIQSTPGYLGTCVEIPGGPTSSAKIPYTSHAHCYSIYNLDKDNFCSQKIGFVGNNEQKEINIALADFLGLWGLLKP